MCYYCTLLENVWNAPWLREEMARTTRLIVNIFKVFVVSTGVPLTGSRLVGHITACVVITQPRFSWVHLVALACTCMELVSLICTFPYLVNLGLSGLIWVTWDKKLQESQNAALRTSHRLSNLSKLLFLKVLKKLLLLFFFI